MSEATPGEPARSKDFRGVAGEDLAGLTEEEPLASSCSDGGRPGSPEAAAGRFPWKL